MYDWLENALETEYEPVRLLKESPRGSVHLIRHRGSGSEDGAGNRTTFAGPVTVESSNGWIDLDERVVEDNGTDIDNRCGQALELDETVFR